MALSRSVLLGSPPSYAGSQAVTAADVVAVADVLGVSLDYARAVVDSIGIGDSGSFSVAGGGSITHGRQITASNTGHTAYFDTGLGRIVTDSDLTVHNSLVSMSDFVGNGGTIAKRWFKGGLIHDRDNVTLLASRWTGSVSGYYAGVHHPFNLQWCSIDTDAGAAQDDGIHYQDYTAYRCRIGGSSDGCKTNGGVTLTECFIRVKGQDSADHNDGTQNVGGGSNTVQRCNIDCRPTNGTGAPNAALFSADSSSGTQTWTDNWVAGGGYVIRCYENALYVVTGNDVLNNSWVFGPAARAVIPQSNLTWSNNRIVDGSGNLVSALTAP